MTDRRDPIERAIEVIVYAPLGLGLFLKDLAPSLVDTAVARGRAEVDRRHAELSQRVTTARSLGEVTLAFGLPRVRSRVQRHVDEVRERLAPPPPARPVRTAPPPAAPPMAAAPAAANGTDGGTGETGGTRPASGDLPIPGYDALSASQVVERLLGLGPDELAAVRQYEKAHRNRRTILGKIEQLAS